MAVEMAAARRLFTRYAFVNNLAQLLVVRLAGRAIVAIQGPIVLAADTEPEPDVAIVRRRTPPYKEREAHAEDALLLIEVAESSLAYDRSTKLRLYAAAGIPEYWVVDCAASVSPLAFPDVSVTLAEIFA
jgi:Uma2 family endonuclease